MANIPASNISIQDPGLGVSSLATIRPVVVGGASSGTANQLQFFSSPAKLVEAFGYGDGVEDALQVLAYAGGPVGFVRATTTVAAANSAVTTSGAGPTVTVAGTAVFDFSAIVEIMLGGALGVGKFRYSIDQHTGLTASERTYSGTLAIPSGGTYLIPGTGITVTFGAGTYVLGDTYTFTGAAAAMNSTNVTAAMTALNASPLAWRFVHLALGKGAGDATAVAALIATAQSALATMQTNEKFRTFIAPTTADDSIVAATVLTAYSTVVANRALIAHGSARYVGQYPLPGRGFVDRPVAISFAARAAGSLVSTDLKRVQGNGLQDGGPLPGIVKLYFDERVEASGLDDVMVSTARTYEGRPGYYITQGRIKSATGSDFTIWPRRLVLDVACEVAHDIAVGFIGRGVRTNSDGTIDERDALRLEKEVNDALAAQLLSPRNADGTDGHASAVRYVIDRSINIIATSTIEADVMVRPLGYIDYITTRVGYSLTGFTEEEV